MKKKRIIDTENLYSDEINLSLQDDLADYILLNLRKIEEHRQNFSLPVIGIAGAEGKTTTKRMLSAILSRVGKVLETPVDCSTTSGVTSTLLKLDKTHHFMILELGILNRKQFELAVQVSKPNIGVVTNIGEAHLATLGDKYLIADTKVELIRNIPTDGFTILNIDDELVSDMEKYSPTPRIIKFGLNPISHFFASQIQYLGPEGISFKVNDYYSLHLPVYSSAFVYNALAAISTARILDISFEDIKQSLENDFRIMQHRGNLIKKNDVFILDNTYDATINSVSKACESLVQFHPFSDKLILVVGDIGNPGTDPIQTHLNLGFYLSALPIDIVITYGEQAKYIADGILKINHTRKQIEVCHNEPELLKSILKYVSPKSTLMMIGKKELQLSAVLDRLLSQL